MVKSKEFSNTILNIKYSISISIYYEIRSYYS